MLTILLHKLCKLLTWTIPQMGLDDEEVANDRPR